MLKFSYAGYLGLSSGISLQFTLEMSINYKLYAMSVSIFLPHTDRFAKFFHCQTCTRGRQFATKQH